MHFTGPIYRPPVEAMMGTELLQVTVGCAHNGISHCDGYMLGVAGKGKGIENAEDSARLINESKPSIIWYGTLGLFEGGEMHLAMLNGEFKQATEREIIEEEIRELIKRTINIITK